MTCTRVVLKGANMETTSLSNISNIGDELAQSGMLDSITHLVGGSRETTKRTLNAAIPMTMYNIADHASTESGAAGLLESLRTGSAPQLDVSNLGRTLQDPQASERLMQSGEGFLERMLGSSFGGMVSRLSSFGGGDRNVVAKLLSLCAPVVLGLLGRRVREGGLDASGLAGYLRQQKTSVAALVPSSLRDEATVPTVTNGRVTDVRVRDVEVGSPYSVPEVARPVAPRTRWMWWVVGAMVAIIVASWIISRAIGGRQPATIESAPPLPAPTEPAQPTPPQ